MSRQQAAVSGQVDHYIGERMLHYGIPGLSLAVVQEGQTIKLQGYGLASVELEVPAVPESVYPLYSVTKIFAGVAILLLVEEGSLTLDTPVIELVMGLPPTWSAIRVRHLLSHTSGLPEKEDSPGFARLTDDQRKQLTPEEAIRLTAEAPLRFPPGARFQYHRSGYTLLGLIVEKRTQRTFPAFLAERVFGPLGMSSTQFGDSEVVIKGRPSTAYNRETGELRNWVYSFGYGNPGSGLNSSAADLARFLVALDAGQLLRPESLRAMWSPVRLTDGTVQEYGLGWTVGEHRGHQLVGHEGGGSAWVAHLPEERLSVILLCNLNGVRADEMPGAIADLYLAS